MSEIIDNAIRIQKLIHKLKDFLKDEKNINELKQFIWNRLPHKYKDNNNDTYNYISYNISNSLNGLSTRSNDNFLFTIKQITDLDLINDLLKFIDSDYICYDEINKINNKINERLNNLEKKINELKTIINENKVVHDFESIMKFIDKSIQEYNETNTENNVCYEKLIFKQQYSLVIKYILKYFKSDSKEHNISFTTEQLKDYAYNYLTYCPHTDLEELSKIFS